MFDASFDSVTSIDEEGYILSLPSNYRGSTLYINELIPEVHGTGDQVEIWEHDGGRGREHDTLDFTGVAADTDTVTVNVDDSYGVEIQLGISAAETGLVFEFDNNGALAAGTRAVPIGATAAECAMNLAKAILQAHLDGILPVQVWIEGTTVHVKNLVPGDLTLTAEASAAITRANASGGADPTTGWTRVFVASISDGHPIPVRMTLNGGVFIKTIDGDANNPVVTVTFKHTGSAPRLTGKGVSGMNPGTLTFE